MRPDFDLTPETPARADTPARRPLSPRARRWCLVILPGAMLTVGTLLLIALGLAGARPRWWRDIDPGDAHVTAAALRVENGAATQLTQIRAADQSTQASAPWTVRISSSDANAWLAARLRPWLESQSSDFRWPDGLRGVEVRFDSGRIDVGASVTLKTPPAAKPHDQPDSPAEQVITASLRPEFRDNGSLWLPAAGTSIGRLSVPPSWMLARAAPKARVKSGPPRTMPEALANLPEMHEVIAALSGDRPVMQTPIIRIGDGRRVRLLKLEPRDDALYITCQTLPRETMRAER